MNATVPEIVPSSAGVSPTLVASKTAATAQPSAFASDRRGARA
jgi:hypothetical protein